MKTLNPLYRFVSLIAILCWEIKAALYVAITFAWEAIICSISGTTVVCRQATMSLCISLIVYHANDGTQAALPSSNSSEPQTADPNPSCSHETPRRPQLSCRDRLRGTASSRAIGLLRTAPNSSALTLLISPHLQVQPFWVSAPFSQAATFLNLARATAFANCCPYGNPSVSSDISGVGWRLEGSLSFEWCRGARCREIFKGVIHHTLAWIGLGLRHRNSIYWDASAQCQPLTEQGKRTWQLAYGVWGGALALPVCIHQSWTKKKAVGRGRLICNAYITDMMSCTDSAAQTVNFDLRFYNRMITKGEVRRHNRMQSCTTYSQFNLFIINPRKSWLLHNVQRNETYK